MSKKWWISMWLTLAVLLGIFIKWSRYIESPEVIRTLENINIGLMIICVGVILGGLMWGDR